MDTIKKLVKPGAIIQGGAFRLDNGPTTAELASFRHAISLHLECRKLGVYTKLGCIVNDLALKPSERPKLTKVHPLPEEYIKLLGEADIPAEAVAIFYESTLRNKAQKDAKDGLNVTRKINESSGIPVPVCVSIMGRYYMDLAEAAYPQQVGFYARNTVPEIPEEKPDRACPFGPIRGAVKEYSGYSTTIEVLNYFVHPDGSITTGGIFEPQK